MFKKGYKQTEEHKRRIGLANSVALKGNKPSLETRLKLSEIHKKLGTMPPHPKGKDHPLFGKPRSEETKRKISENRQKYVVPKSAFKKGMIPWNKGKKLPQMSGENHPNWQGGKSFEPYGVDWKKTIRIAIRERDKYICQVCGMQQDEEAHTVHHIDYNKKNNNPDNLITLCRSCHMKTNYNRSYWIDLFMSE